MGLGAILLTLGIVLAQGVITRDQPAQVSVIGQLSIHETLVLYPDLNGQPDLGNPIGPNDLLDFGDVELDAFGNISGGPPRVHLYVFNNAGSDITLTVDGSGDGLQPPIEVLFGPRGGEISPAHQNATEIAVGQIFTADLGMRFAEAPGTGDINFIVTFSAESDSTPAPTPTPTPQPTPPAPTPTPTPVTGDRVVTKTRDTNDGVCDADCSLREAIAIALSGESIGIPPGIYTLTLGTELTIDKDLTLIGAGSGYTIVEAAILSADATSRVFNITASAVALSGLAVQNGNFSGNGAGMFNSGTLTLTDIKVSENKGNFGGGIYSLGGTVALTNSTVSNNTAEFGGGILHSNGSVILTDSTISDNTASGDGGGIFNNVGGTLTLTNSTITGNTAARNGGGIVNNINGTLTDSTVSSNVAEFGGGIYNAINGTLALTGGAITDNLSTGLFLSGGGGIYNAGGSLTLTSSIISRNSAGEDGGAFNGEGGGIYNEDGTVTVTDTTISDNTAIDKNRNGGGGIYNSLDGTMTVTNSTITGNTMELGSGGGVINYGDLTVTNSTITGNIATHTAGAIYNARGTLTLIDSTLSGNSANFGGSIYNSVSGILSLISTTVSGNTADSDGGGIYNSFGPVTLTNSTVSGNTATGDGGGIYNKDRLTVTNSTVTRNMVETGIGGGIFIDNISNPALAITELGSSIIAETRHRQTLGRTATAL